MCCVVWVGVVVIGCCEVVVGLMCIFGVVDDDGCWSV